jgi:DNA-binding PadR family transcriptional regulator
MTNEPISLSKELVAASSRPMVLSILAGGESYGYEILQRVTLLSRGRVQWSDGMLYPVLRRLEQDGLIEGEWRTGESGRRRRYYRLSRKGQRQLATDREGWLAVHGALTESWG